MNFRIAVLVTALMPAVAGGQQVVEIDFANGRDVINDELRAIHLSPIAIDHGRGALYVRDLAEPNGIMVFSLETGEWLRTYRVPRGEGPDRVLCRPAQPRVPVAPRVPRHLQGQRPGISSRLR